jgi:hypothetical protein
MLTAKPIKAKKPLKKKAISDSDSGSFSDDSFSQNDDDVDFEDEDVYDGFEQESAIPKAKAKSSVTATKPKVSSSKGGKTVEEVGLSIYLLQAKHSSYLHYCRSIRKRRSLSTFFFVRILTSAPLSPFPVRCGYLKMKR